MRAPAYAAALGIAAALAAPATAEAPRPDRYELKAADGGFLRLDRETGATAFCTLSGDGYACRPASDGPAASSPEIDRLKERVAVLEATVKTLSSGLPPAPVLPKDDSLVETDPTLKLPSDADVDRALSFVEKALRRFKRFADEMERPQEGERL